jgi:EAL domain-containing protein (putative c-di-GMP-specific phosphodiesterase class I)/CheY-like chemotaxis protein
MVSSRRIRTVLKNQECAMNHQGPAAFSPVATFGRRKVAPRICVVDGKPHIRRFLAEALEELGFITCDCALASDLRAVLDQQAPDLLVMGLSAGGNDAAATLEVIAASGFGGKVMLLGPRDSLIAAAVQERGEQLGIGMLPRLMTPFDSGSLRSSVATLLPVEAPPHPVIDAAEALSAGWLELWYQPKFSTRTLQMCGAEALIRVRHPTWGVVPPAYFLPDKTDPHLRALSDFVIGRTIDDWSRFIAQHPGIEIAINLPVSFFQNAESVITLCRQMSSHPGINGLIIEVDAGDIIHNLDLIRAAARQLRFGNIAISMDDLGSEWPSLVGLDDLPFVEIKVDRPFITGCADDRLKQTVCRQIIDIADSLGARTVAEGVETRGDFFTVRELGFDLAQGFLLAKPMTAQKFGQASSRHGLTMPQ